MYYMHPVFDTVLYKLSPSKANVGFTTVSEYDIYERHICTYCIETAATYKFKQLPVFSILNHPFGCFLDLDGVPVKRAFEWKADCIKYMITLTKGD